MPNIKNSAVLQAIMDRAKRLKEGLKCGMSRELILAAAMEEVQERVNRGTDQDGQEELRRCEALLQSSKMNAGELIERGQAKQDTVQETLLISVLQSKAAQEAAKSADGFLTADLYLKMLLESISGVGTSSQKKEASAEIPAWLRRAKQGNDAPTSKQEMESGTEEKDKTVQEKGAFSVPKLMKSARELYSALKKRVLGQELAISTFAMDYFIAGMKARTESDRVRPMATFLFAGPPGVGKTLLSETAAKLLGLPFQRFDMSGYSGPDSVHRLAGTPKSYQGQKEGELTSFVKKSPRCIILFDEIEKAHEDAVLLFLQILDAGRLKDANSEQVVSFRDAILIFTTNAGRNLYESTSDKLSSLSRDVIMDAIRSDVDPSTGNAYFPAAICSRLATGSVLMFDYLSN